MIDTAAPPERQIEEHTSAPRTSREAYRIRGEKLVGKIKELVREGNVRHVVIKGKKGKTLVEFPLTVGVAGALLAPAWAAVGAIAALVTDCSVEIERQRELTE